MQRKRFLDKVSRIFLKKVPEMCNYTQKRYQKVYGITFLALE